MSTWDATIRQFSGAIKHASAIPISIEVIVCYGPLSNYLLCIDGIEITIGSPLEDNYRHTAFRPYSQPRAHRLEGEEPLVIRVWPTPSHCTEAANCARTCCKLDTGDYANRHEKVRVGGSEHNRHCSPRRETCHINTI